MKTIYSLTFLLTLTISLFAQSSFTFNPTVISTTLNTAQNLENIDFNGDGLDDILVGGEKILWFESDSSGNLTEHEIASSPGTTITSRPADFDNDGDIDFVSSHWERNLISLWLNDGSQNFTETIVLENFIGAHDAVIADINQDGFNDIVCARGDAAAEGEIVLLLNNGDNTFTNSQVYLGSFCHSIDVTDFNNDGHLDLTSSHIDEGVRTFINNGTNTFTETLYAIPQAHFVRICDLDSDGDNDVLCAALTSSVCMLENIDGSNFTKKYLSYYYALFLDPVDFNKDGHVDILIAETSNRNLRILMNQGDNTFISQKINSSSFRGASGTCVFDLGGDGDLDIISSSWNALKQIKLWENLEVTDVEDDDSLPSDFKLYQNYPNPFNPSTAICYEIPDAGDSYNASDNIVSLKVYDMLGREVAELVNAYQPAGNYEVSFDGSRLSSGIYFYTLSCGTYFQIAKMILLK